MGLFVGFTLIAPLSNQRRYEIVLSEILQFLKAHEHELTIELYPNRFLNFQPLYGGEIVSLPLSIYHLRTSYFKLYINTKPPEDVKRFAAIAWEVLNILKENFPSHLHLYQENLECCEPFYKPLTAKEELRRQLSCLMSKQDISKSLLQEEIDDIWYLLEACHRSKEAKGVTTCLEILDSAHHCPEPLLKQNAEEHNIKLLNEVIGEEEVPALDTISEMNRILAKKVLLKIKDGRMYERPLAEKDPNRSVGEVEEVSLTKSFDQPPSLRVCIFQLSESNDLERVTFILQSIAKYPKSDLLTLKKSGIIQKIVKVLQKYCNGDYGFDQEISKLDFTEFLQGGVFTMLGQVVEEAFIYVYDKAINSCMEWNSKLPKFVHETLQFFELGVNLKCSKYYEEMRGVYQMLKKRITGLTPQELNVAKVYMTFFPEKVVGGAEIAEEPEDSSRDLKVICPVLYNALSKVNELLVKLEALKEYAETHQEKYTKLFNPTLAGGAVPIMDKKYAQNMSTIGMSDNSMDIRDNKLTI